MIFWARCNGCPPLPLDRSIGQKDKKKNLIYEIRNILHFESSEFDRLKFY